MSTVNSRAPLSQHNLHEILHITEKLIWPLHCCEMTSLSEGLAISIIVKDVKHTCSCCL